MAKRCNMANEVSDTRRKQIDGSEAHDGDELSLEQLEDVSGGAAQPKPS